MAIEHLMRSRAPKVIIATTTLGQGVNVGISSVIVATPYTGQDAIDKRDFWNICGRAGRAFVDGEGKVLYAIDDVLTKTRTTWHVRKDENLAKKYFDSGSIDPVESGLLFVINILRHIAERAGVSFDVLIELVANNDFGKLGERGPRFEAILDLIDDGLLALHEDLSANHFEDDSLEWVDQAFRQSLAAIQARSGVDQSSTDDVIHFLQARAASTLKRIPDRATRKAIVASGLPLSVAVTAHGDLDSFRDLADEYLQSDMSLSSVTSVVKKIESWARENASSITGEMPEELKLDALRERWLSGAGLRELIEQDSDAAAICKDLYGYQLPWVIHAISQEFDKIAEKERISALAQIALIVEIGVPTELAARIFLAGIRSRAAATELSGLDVSFGSSVSAIGSNFRSVNFIEVLIPKVSQPTAEWLGLMLADESQRKSSATGFARFKLKQPVDVDTLYARTSGENVFLCSLDGMTRIGVKSSGRLPFDQVADDPRFVFERAGQTWYIASRDPRCIINRL